MKAKNLKDVLLFIDFKKAFDSIHRDKMLKILKVYGIPNELVNAIDKLYEGARARVLPPDGGNRLFPAASRCTSG